jgi:hypothetical protein
MAASNAKQKLDKKRIITKVYLFIVFITPLVLHIFHTFNKIPNKFNFD